MYELKMTFETEYDLLEFTKRIESATNYAIAFDQIDQNFRSMVKYQDDESLGKMIRQSCESEYATPRDAIDMCRTIVRETLDSCGVRLD